MKMIFPLKNEAQPWDEEVTNWSTNTFTIIAEADKAKGAQCIGLEDCFAKIEKGQTRDSNAHW